MQIYCLVSEIRSVIVDPVLATTDHARKKNHIVHHIP